MCLERLQNASGAFDGGIKEVLHGVVNLEAVGGSSVDDIVKARAGLEHLSQLKINMMRHA